MHTYSLTHSFTDPHRFDTEAAAAKLTNLLPYFYVLFSEAPNTVMSIQPKDSSKLFLNHILKVVRFSKLRIIIE